MALRGVIGAIVAGSAGAVWTAATTKDKRWKTQRFLVTYLNGHTEEKELVLGTVEYKELMKHLLDEE